MIVPSRSRNTARSIFLADFPQSCRQRKQNQPPNRTAARGLISVQSQPEGSSAELNSAVSPTCSRQASACSETTALATVRSMQLCHTAQGGGAAIQEQHPKPKGRGINGRGMKPRNRFSIALPFIPLPISLRWVLPNPGALRPLFAAREDSGVLRYQGKLVEFSNVLRFLRLFAAILFRCGFDAASA